MKIVLHNSPQTILHACAQKGIILPASCGGRKCCGKCRVQIIEGQVSGDTPDAQGFVRACAAVPITDITINCQENSELLSNELGDIALAAHNPPPVRAAIALDIGTTTVCARLIDAETATVLDTVSQLNDQRSFGADVMTRISAAREGKTAELFAAINRQTEKIIRLFKERWNIHTVEQLAVSGNTVMLHLFLNIDPSGMGSLPFTPVFLEEKILAGDSLSLSVERITVLPCIAAFIGADVVAGLAVLNMDNISMPTLLVDIGTNGEMALATQERIICCSTAAGPAFEGAEISCGMGGVKGAISAAAFENNAILLTTIGNVPPLGICGSGLVDAVALMLKQGIIDESGSMVNAEQGFKLAPGVSISGRDIRQFQLAKSAIFSGIRLLCKKAGLSVTDIRTVYIAGGFGFFINKFNAISAGIFPGEFLDSLSVCGNVSLQGAEQALGDPGFMRRCKEIISRCVVMDLAAEPSFTEEFSQNLLFNL